MQKKNSPVTKIINNFKRLIPFVGVLFVVAGVIGLLLVQQPLEGSQDTRSNASEIDTTNKQAVLTGDLQKPFYISQPGEISLSIDPAGQIIQKVNLIFSIVNSAIDTPLVRVNALSGYKAEAINIEKTQDGYLVEVQAIATDTRFLFSKDQTFLQISAVSPKVGVISIHFDQDNSYITTVSEKKLLKVPETLTYSITNPLDDDDSSDNGDSSSENNNTDDEIAQCNEVCSNNAQCAVGMRCFSDGNTQTCRLATNTSSTTCSPANNSDDDDEVVLRSCNQFCNNNSECATGLTCHDSFCRNPSNPQDNRCANPTAQQTAAVTQSCGETCSANADCAINLRCYQGECRLATNPSSTSCSAATQKTVSTVYENKATNTSQPDAVAKSDTPLKGSNMIPDTQSGESQDQTSQESLTPTPLVAVDRENYETTYASDETLLGLIKNMVTDNSAKLPFLIILLGILLLVGSLLLLLVSNLSKSRKQKAQMKQFQGDGKIHVESYPVESHPVKSEAVQPFTQTQPTPATQTTATPSITHNPVTQNLLKKLEEEQKNNSQT